MKMLVFKKTLQGFNIARKLKFTKMQCIIVICKE